jgi:UDPglucose 6-dehydrogenase
MKICVIGTGYVGLVTGVCLADSGFKVTCIDKDLDKIKSLNKGISPIYEPGLAELLRKNLNHTLFFLPEMDQKLIAETDIFFLAVGTPSQSNGRPNLSYVFDVAQELGNKFKEIKEKAYKIIVVKSTVPPGTTLRIRNKIEKYLNESRVKIDMVFCPEFLREGSAIDDTFYPDRVVVGAGGEKPVKILNKLFARLIRRDNPGFLSTDISSAEMIKYASNAFLATKISFINEISYLCEQIGANIEDVAKGVGMDNRIGSSFLKAGIGYGGSCFPKDTNGLDHFAGDHGHTFHLLKAVIDVNNIQKKRFINKISKVLDGVEDKSIGVLGLAFKANTDDIRESIAIDLIKILIEKGANVRAHDPLAEENAARHFEKEDNLVFCNDPYEVADGADAVIIATEWDKFKKMDLGRLKSQMKNAVIFDGRNLLNPEKVKDAGLEYYAIGGYDGSAKIKAQNAKPEIKI